MIQKLKFRQRIFALFLVSLLLVSIFPFGVFAYRYNGSFSDGESALNYFGLSDTPMFNMIDSGQAFMQIHDNVNDFNNLSMFGLTSSNESEYEGYFNSVKQFSGFNVYKTINPDSDDDPNNPIDISSSTYHMLTVFNNGSDTYAYMYYFYVEDGSPVYVVAGPQGNYIASVGTLHCWANEISSSDNNGVAMNYDSYVHVNNGVNYVSYGESIRNNLVFTDMSVYNATDSGNSGFTNSGFSGGTADFDFANVANYYDFNLPKTSGDFTDPNAPSQPEGEDTLARYYFKFSDTTYYAGSDFMNMYHVNTFTLNEYQVQHPEQYKISFHYQVAVNAFSNQGIRDWPLDNYYYYDTVVDLASMLAQNKRHNTPSMVAVNVSANLFNSEDGQTNLRDVLTTVVNKVDGTAIEVASPKTLFESILEGAGDFLQSLDEKYIYSTTNIPKTLPPIVNTRFTTALNQFAIHDMRITCEVRLMDANNSNFHSNPYKDYYDFVRGDYKVISTLSTNEVNELPEVLNDAPLTTNNGGSVGATNNGTVVNNYINGASGGGAELVKVWTPFTLSEVSYANTHGMFQDILEFMDAESENGFLPVVKQFFSFLPDTIWTYLTISIACICGFAVVRFVLKR